jgi:flagellar biosynthesis GTPase FlhF
MLDLSFIEAEEVVEVGQVYSLDIIRPRFDDYKSEASRIASEAKGLTVQDDESLNIAVALGGNAKKIAKAIDTQRKAIIQEPAEFVKGVNAICKQITESLDEAERITKAKIGQHQARIEMERRKQEEAARKAAAELQAKLQAEADEANRKAREEAARIAEEEARKRKASEAEIEAARKAAAEEAKKHEIEAPTVMAPIIPEQQKIVRTESGSSYQVSRWVCAVVNPDAVPRQYCEPAKRLLDDAVKMGVREIAGCKIEEIMETRFRT